MNILVLIDWDWSQRSKLRDKLKGIFRTDIETIGSRPNNYQPSERKVLGTAHAYDLIILSLS